jgi:hypothetical protein
MISRCCNHTARGSAYPPEGFGAAPSASKNSSKTGGFFRLGITQYIAGHWAELQLINRQRPLKRVNDGVARDAIRTPARYTAPDTRRKVFTASARLPTTRRSIVRPYPKV